MADINPNDAKFVGELVGEATGSIGKLTNNVTGWISNLVDSLGWFEWSLIISIGVIIVVYIILKRKVDELKSMSRSNFIRRRM